MPISDYLSAKWDAKLYNWLLWRRSDSGGFADARISACYQGEQFGSGYRESGDAVLAGDAMDTDDLMQCVRVEAVDEYDALVEWTINNGLRTTQASRCHCHPDTYKDRVDRGKLRLDGLAQGRSAKIERVHVSPERA